MSQAASAMREMVGSHIGRFAIKARLGYGGMGEVFLAEDCVLKRQVALKAIKHEHNQDEQFHRRLLKEAERLSQLNDEHVARIYDIVEHEGSKFLVMEYVEGQTFRARMKEPLTVEEFFSLAEQCLSGLAAAHRRGILHCDLKPENLMITREGQVKVLDFGFARRIETDETRDSLELSKPSLGGTPAYMAPEVLLGRHPDQRSDIFSIGVVLYEALLGRHPFRTEPNAVTAERIIREQPHPLPETVPSSLGLIVTHMLAKDPAQRYQSCADVLADLRAVQAGGRPRHGKSTWVREHLMVSVISPALVLTMVAAFLWHRAPSVPAPASTSSFSRQLVVLPFVAVTDDARVFAAGLTDTMIAKLGQISDRYSLEIVATSEAQKLKVNDAETARTILGATMVLEGSMQLSGGTMRVTYKLVDTHSLHQVHSGVITADVSNPFAVQDRVIEEVLSSLNIVLEQQDRGRMESHGTAQPEAYSSYLRGRGYLQDYDRPENVDNAIVAFQHSVEADPHFALAYAALGQAYMQKYSTAHTPDSVNAAKSACSRAAELDNGSPDGEICLGMVFNNTGDYENAVQHLERAIKLDPSRDQSYRELGVAYGRLQRPDKAESVMKMAIALRPQYWAGYSRLGTFYLLHGKNDQAIEQFNRVIALAPDSFSGYSNLGAAYITGGKYLEAIDALQRSTSIRPDGPALSNLGVAYFYQHRYEEAAEAYERAANMRRTNYAIFGNVAEAYAQVKGKQQESRDNYSQALKLAEQQLDVNPKDGPVLLDAAVYAATLGEPSKAENYRQRGLKLAARDPEVRLHSAQVLAQFHKDKPAIAELRQALKAGLSPTEISNNPVWERFAAYPEYTGMMARAKNKKQSRAKDKKQ
jgi:eukaryotic-like serine/threonine-protein kinase